LSNKNLEKTRQGVEGNFRLANAKNFDYKNISLALSAGGGLRVGRENRKGLKIERGDLLCLSD
jgi:hypothetical protein